MKKLLLSTTAIVAAGVIAAPANAADRIKLSLGGGAEQFIGFADAEEDIGVTEFAPFDVQSDAEIHVVGSTTLDNGIRIGARYEFEADAGRGGVDEAWVDISGSFGALRLGQDDMVNGQTSISGPRGVGGDYDNWVQEGNITKNDSAYFLRSGDSHRISYFTPRVGGLQAAASYMPEIGDNGGDPANRVLDAGQAFAYSVSYKGELQGVGVDLVYGYYRDTGPSPANRAPAEGHNIGAQFKYSGFTVGGGVAMQDENATINANAGGVRSGVVWVGGISYDTGPISVGFWHLTSENEGTYTTAATAIGDDEVNTNLVFFDYTISDGVRWRSFVFHVNYDEESNVDANEQGGGWGVVGGLALAF